jgi:hypothetical protein
MQGKRVKKITDRQLLSSLPLLRLEKEYLDAAKEKDHVNAKKIIKTFHQQYFAKLTVTGRRKLANRLAKITDVLNRKEKYVKMIDSKDELYKVHRTWDVIKYECQICRIKSNSKFPKLFPCEHQTVCENCQQGLTSCVTCKTQVNYEMMSNFRKSIESQIRREKLETSANAEREKANKILRKQALLERRQMALQGIELEQKFKDQIAENIKQKEIEEKLAIQAKAKAMREGKSFKNSDRGSSKLRQARKSWIKKPAKMKLPDLYKVWHKQKHVTGRDGTGLDDQLSAEAEKMERGGFRMSDWEFDVHYDGTPFILKYPIAPSSKLARDRARDTPAVSELEEMYCSDEDFIRTSEKQLFHELNVQIRERTQMLQEDYESSIGRLINSTKTGREYDTAKEIMNSNRTANLKNLEDMETNVFAKLKKESDKRRYERKERFLHALMSLLHNDHSLKIYFEYCYKNKVHPDRNFVYKLNAYHRITCFDKDPGSQNDMGGYYNDDTVLQFHGGRFALEQAKAILLVLPKMVNLKHISVTELIHDNVVGEFIDRLIDLKNLEKLELVGALQSGIGNGSNRFKHLHQDVVSNIGNNIGKVYKTKSHRKKALKLYDKDLTSHVNKRRGKRVKNTIEFYEKFHEFKSLKYLNLSCNNIGDQGLKGLISNKIGWKSHNLTVLKISKINISGLSGKNLAELIIQLQELKRQQDPSSKQSMELIDISWNNLNLIGLKAFVNALNRYEDEIVLNTLNMTWVGLQERCLKHILSFITSEKAATIPNIKLLAINGGEGGGHDRLSEESTTALKNGIKLHKENCLKHDLEQLRLKEQLKNKKVGEEEGRIE